MLAVKYPIVCTVCDTVYQFSDIKGVKGICPICVYKKKKQQDKAWVTKLVLAIFLFGINLIALGFILYAVRSFI